MNIKGCYLCDNSDKNPKMKCLCVLQSYFERAEISSLVKIAVHAVVYCTKGVGGQKVPRLLEFKRCKGCQGIKGAKGAWVKSSQGLLGGRVFSRTHFRSSLTPEEGPSCLYFIYHIFTLISTFP